MAADGNALVPLRQKTKQKSQEIVVMSRRRISCKDLGRADYQGWLYKKKEKGPFIGNKWKKFWFVLKESSLYWYSSQLAEKAEGFINLPNFTVDRASECKKKYAIKVSHPQIKTFYFAAENVEEMNRWLNKLGLAVIPLASDGKNEEECYSESEHEDLEIAGETPLPPYTEQPPPPHLIHADDHPTADCSEMAESQLLRSNNGSQNSLLSEDTTSSDSSRDRLTVPEDLIGARTLSKEQAKCSEDEMERLYKSLEQASLSPIGDRRPSTKKELRKSFAKRSKNPSMNEKLHQIRMLNSTLKCKEHDLAMINQLLEDPELTAKKYREWKNTNTMLVQEIYQQHDALAVVEGNSKEP
ncbi:interactor protein for cytohesin exchange factors 1 isoform X4 [Chelonia mydas]|uniref:interactor protein for cytohesin exchange factors 1 isoform X4 n=2 Tax=Chelonia mydas TaxID=8469 RepID=UPI0018A1CA7E|nr:interactor protein for cytohesin exchange factors 1 isoform X4 [Chelonia mydas]